MREAAGASRRETDVEVGVGVVVLWCCGCVTDNACCCADNASRDLDPSEAQLTPVDTKGAQPERKPLSPLSIRWFVGEMTSDEQKRAGSIPDNLEATPSQTKKQRHQQLQSNKTVYSDPNSQCINYFRVSSFHAPF